MNTNNTAANKFAAALSTATQTLGIQLQNDPQELAKLLAELHYSNGYHEFWNELFTPAHGSIYGSLGKVRYAIRGLCRNDQVLRQIEPEQWPLVLSFVCAEIGNDVVLSKKLYNEALDTWQTIEIKMIADGEIQELSIDHIQVIEDEFTYKGAPRRQRDDVIVEDPAKVLNQHNNGNKRRTVRGKKYRTKNIKTAKPKKEKKNKKQDRKAAKNAAKNAA